MSAARSWYSFESNTLFADGDGPLTQEQVDAIWRHLPTTGCSWVARGHLFVQRCADAPEVCLGPVERGVRGVSASVRFGAAT